MLNVYSHIHSTFSYDGKWPLEKVVSRFRYLGADILLCSEHSQRIGTGGYSEFRRKCRELSTDRLRVVAGIEYSTQKNYIHFPTWGLDEYLGEELHPEDILAAAKDKQAFCIMAHPDRRDAWKDFKSEWSATGLTGIEIWNRKTDGLAPSANAIRLAREHALNPIASVDFHDGKQLYPLYNVLHADRELLGEPDGEIIRFIRQNPMIPMVSGVQVLSGSIVSKLMLSLHSQMDAARRFKNRFKNKSKRRK